MMLNKAWYDSNGSYVPLSDRETKTCIGKALKEHTEVFEYTQIGGYIHIFVSDSVSEYDLKGYMEMCIESGDFRFVEEHNHTYRYIEGDRVIKLKMV